MTRRLMNPVRSPARCTHGRRGLAQLGSESWAVARRTDGDPAAGRHPGRASTSTRESLAEHGARGSQHGLGTCWVSLRDVSRTEEQEVPGRMLGIRYPLRLASSIASAIPSGSGWPVRPGDASGRRWLERGAAARTLLTVHGSEGMARAMSGYLTRRSGLRAAGPWSTVPETAADRPARHQWAASRSTGTRAAGVKCAYGLPANALGWPAEGPRMTGDDAACIACGDCVRCASRARSGSRGR